MGAFLLLCPVCGYFPVRLGSHSNLASLAHTSTDHNRKRTRGTQRHPIRIHSDVEPVRLRGHLSVLTTQRSRPDHGRPAFNPQRCAQIHVPKHDRLRGGHHFSSNVPCGHQREPANVRRTDPEPLVAKLDRDEAQLGWLFEEISILQHRRVVYVHTANREYDPGVFTDVLDGHFTIGQGIRNRLLTMISTNIITQITIKSPRSP